MKSIVIAIIAVCLFCTYCFAASTSRTTTYPDGRVVVEEEFKGIRGSGSSLAIVVVSIAVLGGIGISVLGIRTIVKAMQLGSTPDVADLEVEVNKEISKA